MSAMKELAVSMIAIREGLSKNMSLNEQALAIAEEVARNYRGKKIPQYTIVTEENGHVHREPTGEVVDPDPALPHTTWMLEQTGSLFVHWDEIYQHIH